MTTTTDLTNIKFVKISGSPALWRVISALPSLATPTTSMTIQGWNTKGDGNFSLETLVIAAVNYDKVIDMVNAQVDGYAS